MSNAGSAEAQRAETRRRILDCTWHLLEHRGSEVSMREIASAAGVTRQTVYDHFGSKSKLLVLVARGRDHLEGLSEQFALALAAPTARGALVATIRTWSRYMPQVVPAARALVHASTPRDDTAAAWWDRLDSAQSTIERVVRRLAEEGELDPIWSIEQAVDILASLTHPRSWNDLVSNRGWSPDAFVDAQVEIATRVLLRKE